jgi:hypothetical protein
VAVWSNRPIRPSSCLWLTLEDDKRDEISFEHLVYSAIGRDMDKVLILTSHPRIILDSVIFLSARNFFIEMISFQGIMSLMSVGLDKVWDG